MSVFWFNLRKKIKDSINKDYVVNNFLIKTKANKQNVSGIVDFHENCTFKKELFVDNVGVQDTNVVNYKQLKDNFINKQKDNLCIIAINVKDYTTGRWDFTYVKEPSNEFFKQDNGGNPLVFEKVHLSVSEYNPTTKEMEFRGGDGFQEWSNVHGSATGTSRYFNNDYFKNPNKLLSVYWYFKFNEKFAVSQGRDRYLHELKINSISGFKYEKRFQTWYIFFNYMPPLKDKENDYQEIPKIDVGEGKIINKKE